MNHCKIPKSWCSVSKHRHVAKLFTVIPRNRPILVAFYDTHGDTEDTFTTLTPGPHGETSWIAAQKKIEIGSMWYLNISRACAGHCLVISIIYHPWLYWKLLLGNNILLVSDFSEGLASILLMMFLSKDKVPSVEKLYVDFISYGNDKKLSPIESIKTKRCLLLGT